ncbi:Hpt domain-containing protein [Sediminimonas sp.]|uniref:Hpt domain-containing protein n=1 Tax=Sediminimonas sp. TaxID=2823379 RepID=UPI0025E6AE9F|nr:Hpt domain-containing protein [Sediminimonas sp.]
MIDWDRIAELRDEIGVEDFNDVVALFIDEVTEVVEALRADPAPGKLECQLHFLKGSAMNLGFARFAAICQAGEQDAAADRAEQVDVAAILACYDESKAAFLTGLQARLSA